MIRKTVLAALALATAGIVQADMIYDNGSPNLDGASLSELDYPVSADDFSLQAGENVITDIHWWGIYNLGPVADDFTVRFYESVGSVPAAVALAEYSVGAVSRVATGDLVMNNYTVYEYSVDIAPLALDANTTYFVSIANDTGSSTSNWFWAWSANGGTNAYSDSGLGWMLDSRAEMAFTLTDDNLSPIPEPATIGLLGMGVAGLALRRRKRVA